MKKGFFREQALIAAKNKWLGDIILISPIHIRLMVWITAIFMAILICMLCLGSYTKKGIASGFLTPTGGIIKIYAPQPGIISERLVSEGERVRQGQILYVISSERQGEHSSAVQSSISEQMQFRKQSLVEEIKKTRVVQQEEIAAADRKIRSMQNGVENLIAQIAVQKTQLTLANNLWDRYKDLQHRNYISTPQVEEKQLATLEQQNRLRSLEHTLIDATAELEERKSEFRTLGLRQQSALAQLDRSLAGANQDFTESEAKRKLVIVAPEDGIATGLFGEVGQTVTITLPLVSVAKNSDLQVLLYVPTKLIGSVQPGSSVKIRFVAYPYQRFGFGKATIKSISNVPFSNTELLSAGNQYSIGSSEPLYVLRANLAEQNITSSKIKHSLRAGMLVEADIQQEKHRLIEWIFTPFRRIFEPT